jgi:hypothetical protein
MCSQEPHIKSTERLAVIEVQTHLSFSTDSPQKMGVQANHRAGLSAQN